MKNFTYLLTWLVLFCTLNGVVQAQNGYIYVHKKALSESENQNVTFSISGGPTSVANFTLNDFNTQNPIIDVGTSQNGRLWAVTQAGALLYRNQGSSAWTQAAGITASKVDGGQAGSCYYLTNNGLPYYYDGTTSTLLSSSTGHLDIASAQDGAVLVISSDGNLYRRVHATSSTWNNIQNTGDVTHVDGDPSTGDAIIARNTGTNYRVTPTGTTTSLGFITGMVRDIAVTSSGSIFVSNSNYAYKWTGGTSWSGAEITSRKYMTRLTGGPGEMVWGVSNESGLEDIQKNIYSRISSGTEVLWLNDERARISANGNSIMVEVAPGTYTVSEIVPSGWDLVSIKTFDPSDNSTTDVVNNQATVSVAAGETVGLVFENILVSPHSMTLDCSAEYLETFGTGAANTYGSALVGQTSYHFQNAGQSFSNNYMVVGNASALFSGANNVNDHTAGNGQGRMMAVDANNEKDAFFRRRFNNVIPGANYSFTAWIANVNVAGIIKPNVTFEVIDPTTYAVLHSVSSGDITASGWQQFGLASFTTNSTSFDLVIRNNGFGGSGNDLALDDIRFKLESPSQPITSVVHSGCNQSNGSITVTAPLATGIYEYSRNGTAWQTSPEFLNLTPGSYTIYARYIGSTNCTSTKVEVVKVSVCGSVVNDMTGNTNALVDGASPNLAGLHANLLNNAGVVIATVPVDQLTGTYAFPGIAPGTYRVQLNTVAGTPTQAAPAVVMPTGWANTGDVVPSGTAENATPSLSAPITVGTTSISNVNFGINQTPTAVPGTIASTPNPGGTINVPVTNSFGGTDPNSGTITSMTITSFPSDATSITIGGTTYTTGGGGGTTAWPGTVTVLTNASGVPSSAISVDPISGGTTTVSIPFRVTDNAGLISPIATLNVPFVATFSIAGTIFNDNNGTTGNANGGPVNGSSSGTDPLDLVVNLYDAAGEFITSTPVLANGTYSLTNIPAGNGYQVQLNTADNVGQSGENIGLNPTALPADFVHVSSSDGVTPTNGINVLDITANVTGSNFGINEGPTTNPGTITSTTNPGGNISVPVTSSFGGTDPNVGAIASLTITNFPSGATSITIGGTTYTAPGGGGANEWTGPVTVPTNTTGVPNSAISVDPVDGTTTVAIPFTVTDNAGLTSSGGTLNVPFAAPTYAVSGTVYNDADGQTNGADGASFDGSATSLFVNLYDAANNFVASTTVGSNGMYTFSAIPAGTGYQVQVSSVEATTSATLAPNAALPGTYDNVSSNGGTGSPTDGIIAFNVDAANMTGLDFGIQRPPVADDITNPVSTSGDFSSTPPTGFPTESGFLTIPYSELTAFSGSDPEDVTPVIEGSTITIGTVNANTKVYYDFPGGAREVANGEAITSFDPAKLVFYGQVGSGSTANPFGFTYRVTDAAGVASQPANYTFSTGGDPLPVKLSSFTAKKGEGQTAVLDWTTTAETNSEKFEVEHSTDAKIWNVITVKEAKGESNELARYHYTHTNPVAGQNLYRLKMADLDGTFAYSQIVSLSFDHVANATFYPNPATDKVKIKLEGATTGDVTKITLFAVDGKVAYTADKLIQGEIDVTNIPTGTYVVSITLRNGTTQNSKIVIVK